MNNFRNKARELKKNKKFDDAIAIYTNLYDSDSDKWLAWEYAYSLKQVNKIDLAISVCKSTYSENKKFKYNNDLLSWLLYEKYFKISKKVYSRKELETLYEIAFFVSTLVEQGPNSPYEKIVFSTIKIFNNNYSEFTKKVLELLKLIDSTLLSSTPGKFKKKNRESEYQSNKELFYSLKTKALFIDQSYTECIVCCEEALKTIDCFHHNNDLWIQYRKALCFEKIDRNQEAIVMLHELVMKMRHWIFQHASAKIYEKTDNINQAMLYFSMAALDSVTHTMKVTLFQDFAVFLKKNNQPKWAYIHAMYAKELRDSQGWSISQELAALIDDLEQVKYLEQSTISKQDLEDYWLDNIINTLGSESGKITNIHKNHKFGFISCLSKSYYFQMKSVIGKQTIKPSDSVDFIVIDSFDSKKNKATQEAAYIRLTKKK